jgi:glycine/sarcosine N-methyltransferase
MAAETPSHRSHSSGDSHDSHDSRDFYDDLADDYHLIYPDWDASVERQGVALDSVIGGSLGEQSGALDILDCSCGIGTQALGLAARGHRVVGSDLSPASARRAAAEAAKRGAALPTVAADMRRLPFATERFDVVLTADNSVAHLLADEDLLTALRGMRQALRPGGLLVITLRAYENARASHQTVTVPQVTDTAAGRVVTFQLWHWHADGERYDFEHIQLLPDGDSWRVRTRRATSRALLRAELSAAVERAGFAGVRLLDPAESGFFQPVLIARAPARD